MNNIGQMARPATEQVAGELASRMNGEPVDNMSKFPAKGRG